MFFSIHGVIVDHDARGFYVVSGHNWPVRVETDCDAWEMGLRIGDEVSVLLCPSASGMKEDGIKKCVRNAETGAMEWIPWLGPYPRPNLPLGVRIGRAVRRLAGGRYLPVLRMRATWAVYRLRRR